MSGSQGEGLEILGWMLFAILPLGGFTLFFAGVNSGDIIIAVLGVIVGIAASALVYGINSFPG